MSPFDLSRGFVFIPRSIMDSFIWTKPHWYFKAYMYLYIQASHKPFKGCETGEVYLENGYKSLIDGITTMIGYREKKVTKSEISRFMKATTKATLIATRKTTKGLYVKVLGYEEMSDLKNREKITKETTKATTKAYTVVQTLTNTNNTNTTPLPPKGGIEVEVNNPKFHTFDIGKSKPFKISDENLNKLIEVEDYYRELYQRTPGARKQYVKNFVYWNDTYEVRDFKNAIYRAFHTAKWDWLTLVHMFRREKEHQPVDYVATLLNWNETRKPTASPLKSFAELKDDFKRSKSQKDLEDVRAFDAFVKSGGISQEALRQQIFKIDKPTEAFTN